MPIASATALALLTVSPPAHAEAIAPQGAEALPAPEHAEDKIATVNGILTITTSAGTRTITMSDVVHGGDVPCFWRIGGSIHLTGANDVAHVATFTATCGHVTLEGASLALPTKLAHGHGIRHHKFGKPPAPASTDGTNAAH